MNEQWKRLIEAERRLARLESTLQRQNTRIVSVNGAVRNDANDIPTVVTVGGGGGGSGGVHRFPVTFDMWVEWTTEPALITGASSNVPADGPALAEAVDILGVGFTLNASNEDTGRINEFLYDTHSSQPAMFVNLEFAGTATVSGRTEAWTADFKLAYFDDGMFLADAKQPVYSGSLFQGEMGPETTASGAIRMAISWPRRNSGGSWIGSSSISARRNIASEDSFDFGPTHGETGVWSFPMTPVISVRLAHSIAKRHARPAPAPAPSWAPPPPLGRCAVAP
jgi:hypothetical protein